MNYVNASPPQAGVAISIGPFEIATLGLTASLAMTNRPKSYA